MFLSLIKCQSPCEKVQESKARLAEVASELHQLFPGTDEDKVNIDLIVSLLENPPVRP